MMRGKGEGSVYQRAADGMWCVSVELPPSADGRRRRRVIVRKAKADAILALREAQADLHRHGDIVTAGGSTLGEWLDYWLKEIYAPRNEPGTVKNARGHINKWIKPAIGSRPLARLNPTHVRELHRAVSAGSDSTSLVRSVHNTLSTALRDAKREGRMRENPCDLMDRPDATIGEVDGLTLDQAITLMAHIATRADGALWATYLLTGARRGEILGLEADRVGDTLDLSWQLQRITNIEDAPKTRLYRHMGDNLYLKKPKNKKGREIPLVEPLRSILALHMQGRGPGLVFTEPDGSPITPDAATRRWHALLAEAGLPDDVVLHGTRHTTVDLLEAAGVPMHVIREIVGHSTEGMTVRYTRQNNLPKLTAAMEKMSALLSLESPKETQGNP